MMKKIINLSDPSQLKRNIFLSLFLTLIIVVNFGTAILFILNLVGVLERSTYLPLWMVVISTIICIGNVVCAIATWYWQRWGVIGYVVLTLSAYIVTAITTQNYINFLGLVGSILLGLLIWPYWKYMKKISWGRFSLTKAESAPNS
jgi:hypothetical protein